MHSSISYDGDEFTMMAFDGVKKETSVGYDKIRIYHGQLDLMAIGSSGASMSASLIGVNYTDL
jgi:hypothetical protein